MRIKLSQLRRIIKEETYRALHENYSGAEEPVYASPPANRGQRSARADAAIRALLGVTLEDLNAALTAAIAKGIVTAEQVQEIRDLLR